MTRSPGAMRAAPTRAASTSSRTARSPASAASADGEVEGVETTKGFIGCDKLALAAAGNSSRVAEMAGLRLPIESHVLQAFVSRGAEALLDTVVTFGAGHFYFASPTRAASSSAATSTATIPMPSAATSPPSSMWPRPASRWSRACRACACCAPGAASWTCRWTARRSSTGVGWTTSISTPAGATAASRRRPPPASASRI